ncbi:DUF3048 domain-containing protein [Virgibacillus soli]|uniref:DUF3048 domain-containing protein n=1 Tax=Paracerasibacillus soli TaxID=480284 RepID=UPI0035EB5432
MKKVTIALVLLLLLITMGCKKDTAKEREDASNDQMKQEEKSKENQDGLKHTYPFTGLQTTKSIDTRPVGVMINNHAKARPQSGLAQADITFEILAEGNITRFLSIFQSEQPKVVGPVRSAREYYFELAKGYHALYIYHGAAKFVDQMIKDRSIEHLNGAIYDNDKVLFKRESFRKAPHNSYLQYEAVEDTAEKLGYTMKDDLKPLPFLNEEESEHISGDAYKKAEIVYYKNPKTTVTYEYDATKEKYIRFSDGTKTIDMETEKPVELDNVFILETPHHIMDDAGRRKIDIQSGGQAYLLQKGKVQKLQWKNDEGYILPVKDGKPIGFVPGKTWINIVPDNPGLKEEVTLSNESI